MPDLKRRDNSLGALRKLEMIARAECGPRELEQLVEMRALLC